MFQVGNDRMFGEGSRWLEEVYDDVLVVCMQDDQQK